MDSPPAGPEAHYLAELASGRFVLQRCRGCGRHLFYPRTVCPHCSGLDFAWVAPSGLGTVYANTTVRRKPDAGGDYDVSLIDLDEGVRLMSCVIGMPPTQVAVGLRVRARLEAAGGGHRVVFERLEDKS